MAIANFFWHGESLSLYERACIRSFVNKNFYVRVYTFNKNLNVPQGAVICNAEDIYSFNYINKYTQNGKQACLAAFSDAFRYKLLSVSPGWWFDTDVFCLKDASEFDSLEINSKGITCGYQSDSSINGAVIYIRDVEIAKELDARAKQKGENFKWGAIGPALITEYINEKPNDASVLNSNAFYPIPFSAVDDLFVSCTNEFIEKNKSAYCVHLWNEAIVRKNITKEIFPPINSYLYHLFYETGEHVSEYSSISYKTFEALSFFAGIKRSEYKVLFLYRRLRNGLLKIKNLLR